MLSYDYEKLLKCAERQLSRKIGFKFIIAKKTSVTNKIISDLIEIEKKTFKREFRYTIKEFIERSKKKDFVLFITYALRTPFGFALGYKEECNVYYLDTLATILKGRGIGKTLLHLLSIWSFEKGHICITIRTKNDKHHHTIEFYEEEGFYRIPCASSEGIGMKKDLEQRIIDEYFRTISKQ